MRTRLLLVPALVFALLVGGCGGGSSTTLGAGSTTSSSSSSSASTPMTSDPASTCPTENTKSFAKTRFLSDVGGALFLANRYLVKPYQAGKFKQGASGRRVALVKAGIAAATTAKLLKNASENAKANPTLCKTVAAPLGALSESVSKLVNGLKSGQVDAGALAGITGLLGSVKSGAAKAGVPVSEKEVGIGG